MLTGHAIFPCELGPSHRLCSILQNKRWLLLAVLTQQWQQVLAVEVSLSSHLHQLLIIIMLPIIIIMLPASAAVRFVWLLHAACTQIVTGACLPLAAVPDVCCTVATAACSFFSSSVQF